MDILIPRLSWHEDIFSKTRRKAMCTTKKKSKIPLSEAEPMAGFPIGGGHNPSLPPHKCSRTTAERGQVRRDSLARCTPNKRTHLPRIGGVGTVPTGGPGDGSRWEMERGGSTVPPTVGTNQSTVNPPAPATSNCHSPHFPVVGHSDPCWHASFRIVAALHPNRWRHQW